MRKIYSVISTSNFKITLAGLDFNSAPLEVRERFSIINSKVNNLLVSASKKNISSALIVSTCNRTEIYAENCSNAEILDLFISQTEGTYEEFEKYGFILENEEAINHLFRVGCGLESQIIGDVQILGQLKSAASISHDKKMLSPEFDRLIQFVIRAAKKVRSATNLNKGSSSVSYAGVHYVKENISGFEQKNILLFGTGKIGSVTCENLLKHVNHQKLTLINRTQEKAEKLADKFDVSFKGLDNLTTCAKASQIIVVATGNDSPTLTRDNLEDDYSHDPKIILDLSVPRNVDLEVSTIPGVSVLDIDQLSTISKHAIETREASIPEAESIIEEFRNELDVWLLERFKYVPFLKIFRSELNRLVSSEIETLKKNVDEESNLEDLEIITSKVMDKVAFKLMDHLKKDDQHHSVEALTSAFRAESK